MGEIVVFPDASALVVDYLTDAFFARGESVRVGTQLPTPTTGVFVKITRTGGISVDRVIDQAQMTVEVYADDVGSAQDVAQLCRAILHAIEGGTINGHPVYAVRDFAGPQDFPDTLTNQPRYTQTIQVCFRGVVEAEPTLEDDFLPSDELVQHESVARRQLVPPVVVPRRPDEFLPSVDRSIRHEPIAP